MLTEGTKAPKIAGLKEKQPFYTFIQKMTRQVVLQTPAISEIIMHH